MALRITNKVVSFDIKDTPFVHIAKRDHPALD
jgi:hypothetical protein